LSRDLVSSLNETIGILCLSKSNESLLMWSHYAEDYSGGIIEFDENHEFFEGQIGVEYKGYRPIKDITTYISNKQPIPIAELCVKSEQWEHEKEIRVIRSLSNCKKIKSNTKYPVYTMPFPLECIKSVTLGERSSVDKQKEIWDLVKSTQIEMSLACISNWGFDFRYDKIKLQNPYPQMMPILSPRTAHIFKGMPGPLGEAAQWAIDKHPMSKHVNKTL